MIQLYHTALLEVQIFPTQVYPLAELSQVLQGMLSWSMGFNFQLASSPVLQYLITWLASLSLYA